MKKISHDGGVIGPAFGRRGKITVTIKESNSAPRQTNEFCPMPRDEQTQITTR